jgi:hypothetical protein
LRWRRYIGGSEQLSKTSYLYLLNVDFKICPTLRTLVWPILPLEIASTAVGEGSPIAFLNKGNHDDDESDCAPTARQCGATEAGPLG